MHGIHSPATAICRCYLPMGPKGRKTPAKGAEPGVAMQAAGDSDDWVAQKGNQVRIADEFIAQISDSEIKPLLPDGADWETLAGAVRINRTFWGLLATFLCSVYTIAKGKRNAGKHLGSKSVLACWSGLLNQAVDMPYPGLTDEAQVPPEPCGVRCLRVSHLRAVSL